jgi:hypothetical protein
MQSSTSAEMQSSNFALKSEVVELIASRPRSSVSSVTIGELEAMRVESALVPASKHGLETICGGSCETGAQ